MTTINITTTKAAFPGNLADEYLHLKAQIADLKKQEKALQDRIAETGLKVIEGNFGRVNMAVTSGAYLPDYKEAATSNLMPSVLARYTKWRGESVRFTVKARIEKQVA